MRARTAGDAGASEEYLTREVILMTDHARPANRLVHEKSPYLLQHADNPVDATPMATTPKAL